ncbi:MAG: sigma factor-like helix-turn-helix DNA-binding protein [Solirubrobacteraceae bacterium]
MSRLHRPTEPRTPIDLTRVRRVLIEERQQKAVEHARGAAGYNDDVSSHAHDAATFRLINQRKVLDRLWNADHVIPALDQWKHWTKMNDWDSRMRYMEQLVTKLRRRTASSAEIQVLVTLCRGVTVKIAKRLREIDGDFVIDSKGREREEAIRIRDLDRAQIDQVMQHALIDALSHCPSPFPHFFFAWLEKVLAFRALDHIRVELAEPGSGLTFDGGIQTVVDEILGDRDAYGADYFRLPASPAHSQWLRTLDLPAIFELADEYATYARTRTACERAVDRLPMRQRQVIQHHYFQAMTFESVGATIGVAAATARVHHGRAMDRLERDDELYNVLIAIGKVRAYEREIVLRRAA